MTTEQAAKDDAGMQLAQAAPPEEEEHISIDTPKELRGKYTFLNKLGSGTQGNVYRAKRLSDGKILAVKKIRIDSVNTWKEYDLFHREADVLASLHERGIAEFYDALEFLDADPASAYIVQELIEGRSLQLMLKQGFRFTVSRIFKMALGLVELLEKLHSHNPPIIHRDIKPNNIIMKPRSDSDDFDPYLIDFGAVANPTVQKGGSTLAGTYGYMPPEQLVGRPCPASDIYALGATIVYMLSGVEPADMRVADFRLIIDPHLENVPRPIVTVLHQMLDPKPETRLCDYARLKEIFEQFSNDIYILDEAEAGLNAGLVNKKLTQVNAFNQPGNLDLWMQLPEVMPRKVPYAFSNTILGLAQLQRLNQLKKRSNDKTPVRIIAGVVFIACLLLCLFTDIDFGAKVFLAILCALAALFFFMFTIDVLGNRNETRKKLMEIEQISQTYDACKNQTSIQMMCGYEHREDIPMLTLLKLGRKAIATIVDFEDIPVKEKYRKFSPSKGVFSESRVPFRLRYRFNPPDDASADDLVHEVTIYQHQTEGLESGTPIPILYYINPEDNSDVLSMPYPFPFKEIRQSQISIFNKDSLYGHTKGVY
ncbi:MAG: serine/threonine protein kinase [Proteobacteria bacterium]|nr:serine/threonine protein kinase [Pseudomonadota bacterium]